MEIKNGVKLEKIHQKEVKVRTITRKQLIEKVSMFLMFLAPSLVITMGKMMGNTIPQLQTFDCYTMITGSLLMGYNAVSRKKDKIDFTMGLVITAVPFIKILFL